MKWYEMEIHTTEAATDMIAAMLNEWGAGGVSIEESWLKHEGKQSPLGEWYEVLDNQIPIGRATIRAYFSELESVEELKLQVSNLLETLKQSGTDVSPGLIEIGSVDEEDWANAWKQYYHPVRISDRLTVKPTWEDYEPAADELVIELDPGMAFGTGTHATTRLCMNALEKHVQPGQTIIDVGTGSGILAIACAKLGAEKVLALDLDPVAVSSATENVNLNGMASSIQVAQSDLLGVIQSEKSEHHTEASSILTEYVPADLVVANILAEIILRFVDDVYQALKSGGKFIASGIIESKRQEVEEEMLRQGFRIEETVSEQDWIVIVASKP